jgi:hypothetical protein
MSDHVKFIDDYNTFIEATMFDENAFCAGLPDFITGTSVLVEPESIPGLGYLVGIEGWKQWRRTAYNMAVRTGAQPTTTDPQYFENGDVVLRYYEVSLPARANFPDGYRSAIVERYEFTQGKIARLCEFYSDTALFARYFE